MGEALGTVPVVGVRVGQEAGAGPEGKGERIGTVADCADGVTGAPGFVLVMEEVDGRAISV